MFSQVSVHRGSPSRQRGSFVQRVSPSRQKGVSLDRDLSLDRDPFWTETSSRGRLPLWTDTPMERDPLPLEEDPLWEETP